MILSGKSASGIGYEKSEWSRNLSSDLWLLEIDSLGRKIRDKTIGGNSVEEYFSRHGVQKVGDWGYLLAGSSLSTIGYDKTDTCRGDYDFWLILLDTTLQNIKWQGTIGGGATDYCMKTTILSDGSIIAAGYSLSGISGDKKTPGKGGEDYWVVKLKPDRAMALTDLTIQSKVNHQDVSLSWTSSLQKQGDYYVLERSDEKGFITEELHRIPTQNSTQHYYRDRSNDCGNRFYRVTLYSETGEMKARRYTQARVTSPTENLKIRHDASFIYLEHTASVAGKEGQLYDGQGRLINTFSLQNTDYRIPVDQLSSGIYLLYFNQQYFKFHLNK